MKEHTGNTKFLLIIVSALISIANGEVAVLVACLALSACVDEIRIQILFKERRELTNMIKELRFSSETQTVDIRTLRRMSQDVKDEVETQTAEIGTLRRMSQDVKDEVETQTAEIGTLRRMSQQVRNAVSTLRDEIETLSWTGKTGLILTVILGILGILAGFLGPIILTKK